MQIIQTSASIATSFYHSELRINTISWVSIYYHFDDYMLWYGRGRCRNLF
jgi:hypothetical protein